MGQFRLRSKYKKKNIDTDVRNESGLSASASRGKQLSRFRPKSFVMQPRDQTGAGSIRAIGQLSADTVIKRRPETKKNEQTKLPEVGTVLGKCKLTKQIGKGSSCLVFTALHQALQITVAIKVFLPEKNSNIDRFREQFKTEAQLLARLNNQYIVRVLDFEESALPYVILEYVDGHSMLELIKERGAMDLMEACRIIACVADGLETAHKKGIIHRDIKPENILIGKDDQVKLADLGIARITSGMHGSKSKVERGILYGTPAYVAPEQALNPETSDHLSDVYSLGATFFHAVTGRYPFQAKTVREMVSKHISEPLVPPCTMRRELPESISELIQIMMRKNPKERYELSEVKNKLHAILSSNSTKKESFPSPGKPKKVLTTGSLRRAIAKVFSSK